MAPILTTIAWIFLLLGLLPALYLGLLAVVALVPSPKKQLEGGVEKTIAVVVPAHNEQLLIAQTVTGLLQQNYPKQAFTVFVIADNCSDPTAKLAADAGARVLERQANPGKGQALHEAFSLLLEEDWDALLVVDADTQMHPNTLARIADTLLNGEDVVQVRYGVLNPEESWRTAAMELALASFNALRPMGKNRLGSSSGLFGNGFCLSRKALTQVPYLADSIVEDLEYHLQLLHAGFRVRFLDDVWVKAQMPATAADSRSQRVRWERGRFGLVRLLAPGLLRDLLKGRGFALHALIDVCMLPVSLIGLCLMPPLLLGAYSLAANTFASDTLAANTSGAYTVGALALLGMAALGFHYFAAALRYGHLGRTVKVALHVPWYVIWKTWALFSSFIKQRSLGWIRTKRH